MRSVSASLQGSRLLYSRSISSGMAMVYVGQFKTRW